MNIGNFYSVVSRLKNEKRAGWVDRGVNDPETVSSHSFMSALLSLILTPEGIDRERVIKLMLVHDIAESIIGDRITKENWKGGSISKKDKSRLERKALEKILPNLDEKTSREIRSLWNEFEEKKTTESIFANEMDVFEMMLQALEYKKKNNTKKPLEAFWDKQKLEKIKDKRLKSILTEIIDKGR